MVWIEGGHQIDTVDLYKGKIILTKPITHLKKVLSGYLHYFMHLYFTQIFFYFTQ